MNPNETEAPKFPSESPAGWTRVRKAAEGGDTEKTGKTLEAMDLPPRLAKLMVAAVAEETELSAVEKAADGLPEKLAAMEFEGSIAGQITSSTIEQGREAADAGRH